MAARGWVEGRNLTIVDRWVENRPELLPDIVASVLAEKVDILVTAGSVVTKSIFRLSSLESATRSPSGLCKAYRGPAAI